MVWLFFLGVAIAATTSAYSLYGLWGAVYSFLGTVLAFCAGSALRGSLYWKWEQVVGGAVAALVCMAMALWLVQDLNLHVFGYEIVGWHWAVGVFVGCFLLTSRRFVPRME